MIPDDRTVRVRTVGMKYGSNNSVTDDGVDDALALRAVLARQDASTLAGVVTSCVQVAEEAARAVGNLAGDLAAAAGGDGTGPRSGAMEAVYADLEAPFRYWPSELRPGSDAVGLQTAWHRTTHRLVRRAGDELLHTVSPACWEGRKVRDHVLTAAHAADPGSLSPRSRGWSRRARGVIPSSSSPAAAPHSTPETRTSSASRSWPDPPLTDARAAARGPMGLGGSVFTEASRRPRF